MGRPRGKARGQVRIERLQELIRRDVSELLATGLRDPRIKFGSVTGVKLAGDLSTARISVSCLGTEAERRTFMKGLESARGRIRSVIGSHLRTRKVPEIIFHYDEGVERSVRVSQLIDEALAEDREAQIARGDAPSDEEQDEAPVDTDAVREGLEEE